MSKEDQRLKRQLHGLESARRSIAQQIDQSYLREDISTYMALETKYQDIMQKISTVRSQFGNTMIS